MKNKLELAVYEQHVIRYDRSKKTCTYEIKHTFFTLFYLSGCLTLDRLDNTLIIVYTPKSDKRGQIV